MKLSAVLLDKDGTLVDIDRTWGPAMLAALTCIAGDDARKISALANVLQLDARTCSFGRGSPVIAGAPPDYADDCARVLGTTATPHFVERLSSLLAHFGNRYLTPIGEPQRAIHALHALDIPIGLATNHSESAARHQLDSLGIGAYFRFVAGFDSGYGRKPDPGMIIAYATNVGVPLREVAMVGDSLHDMRAARAAGARAIAVTTGYATREELAPYADVVIGQLDDLHDLLGGDGDRL